MSEDIIFNVNSNNQQGGVTAGIVNIFHRARIDLSDENRRQLTKIAADKNSIVHVSLQIGGGSELTQFAEDIKSFLIQQRCSNVLGVHTIMGFTPFKGVIIDEKSNKELVIFIGSRI